MSVTKIEKKYGVLTSFNLKNLVISIFCITFATSKQKNNYERKTT